MILVAGESLIDMIGSPDSKESFRAAAGGSPYNVAMALGRQQVPVKFFGRFSTDRFGQTLSETLEDSQVQLDLCPKTSAPSTIGFAHTSEGSVDYTFYTNNTAGCALSTSDCPNELPDEIRVMHFGSFSLGIEPIASTIDHLLSESCRGDRIVSIDPNIRTFLIDDDQKHRERLDRHLRCANIIKLSDEDLRWLHPDISPEDCVQRYLQNGAQLVAVTLGADGSLASTRSGSARCPVVPGEIADTVGAGDTFQASILAWLHERERMSVAALTALGSDELQSMIEYASRAAAINCTRVGCNPPWRRELSD